MSIYDRFQRWPETPPSAPCGVLVAAEICQEWLLPWWWEHYAKHNAFPVAFVDLGMSATAQQWCQEKGILMRLGVPDLFVAMREEVDLELSADWLGVRGKSFWQVRTSWFKKPLACLKTPFERTIWIDLDCEVRASLAPLFSASENPTGVAIVRHSDAPPVFNSGVIAYRWGNPLFADWAKGAVERNHLFAGDQDVLTALIVEQHLPVVHLPVTWNWSRMWPDAPGIQIYHWHGDHGKSVIYHHIHHQHEVKYDI